MARGLGSPTERIRLIAPSWFDNIFETGTVGNLVIGQDLELKLLQAIDSSPLTRGCGLQIGAVGRASHMRQAITGTHFIRAPDMTHNTSVLIYIGPELSKPPIPPAQSQASKIISELFSTTLNCSLAAAAWVGAIGSAAAIGATGGASAIATVYFAGAASLSSVQCLEAMVHSGAVVAGDDAMAKRMDDSKGWKYVDRFADAVNFLSIAYVGRDLLMLKRALEGAGIRLTDALAGEMSRGGAVTMSDILKLRDAVPDPNAVAADVRQRIFSAVLLGLGVFSSSRDSTGGFVAAKDLIMGADAGSAPTPAHPPGGPGAVRSPAAAAAVFSAVQIGHPGPPGAPNPTAVAPQIVDYMLRYRPDEAATISIILMRKTAGG